MEILLAKKYRFLPLLFLILLAFLLLYVTYKGRSESLMPIVVASNLKECKEFPIGNERVRCNDNLARMLIKKYNLSLIIETVEAVQNNATSKIPCHTFAHHLGRWVFKENNNVSQLFKEASSVCNNGIYHGIVEGYLFGQGQAGLGGNIGGIVEEMCKQAKSDNVSGVYGICLHGAGHAFMFLTNNDLLSSLRFCDSLNGWGRESCYSGVFMENSSSVTDSGDGHPSEYINSEKPLYPCTILEERYLSMCYLYQPYYLLSLNNFNFSETFKQCMAAPEQFQARCFFGIAIKAVSQSSNYSEMESVCKLGYAIAGESGYTGCLRGIAGVLVEHEAGNIEQAGRFCNELDDAYKNMCYQFFGKSLRNWVSDNATLYSKCSFFKTKDAVDLCLYPER